MPDMREEGGLCSSCESAPACALPAKGGAVVECEEHVAPGAAPLARQAGDPPAPPGRGDLGLCANCESVETCTFPQARKGVVFCEEHA